jgi:hypothetical protein
LSFERKISISISLLHFQADSCIQVIDDPVEGGQMDRFDDAHVVEGDVEVVVGKRLEFGAGAAERGTG